jgi:four helix bundle protein
MATFNNFEDIKGWQRARELTREVYRKSKIGPLSRDYGLRDQMRRAAVSVMSNIAEGFERGGTSEFVHFLSIAKGSLGELEAQLYVARDQNYIDDKEFASLKVLAKSTKLIIGGLIGYLRQSGLKGTKYT